MNVAFFAFLKREPLVHFAVLAGLLFAAGHFAGNTPRETLHIDRATQEFVIKERADLVMQPLTPDQQKAVITSFVQDEILWREARKRGLDKTGRIRSQLVRNMRILLSGTVENPREADLLAYYEANPECCLSPASLDLDILFFSAANKIPDGLLDQLRNGADHETFGDDSNQPGRSAVGLPVDRLARRFGPEISRAILDAGDDEWRGPLELQGGRFFFRITKRTQVEKPPFEQVKRYLKGVWIKTRQAEAFQKSFDQIAPEYEVKIEQPGTS
jgi:hypothetical protein